jgi:hypothetical protein
MTASPVSLNTGSHVVEVHADIVKGSSRTFSFSVQTPSDILVSDSNYGANLSVSGTFPMSTSQTTINSGSVSVTTDPNFTTTQALISASNVTLGQWLAKAYGEDMRLGQIKVKLQLSGTSVSGNYINNIALYVNGAQVGTTQNWAVGAGTNATTTLTFGSGNLVTLYAGQEVVLSVKGDTSLASTVTGVTASVVLPANQAQGLSSYTTWPPSESTFSGQNLSFVSGALTVSANPSFSNISVGPNVSKQKIGSYVLKASNADSVQVTQITVGVGGSLPIQYLSNLYISDNTTPVFPQSQNTFTTNFTIGPNQSHVVDVYADIGNQTGTVTTTLSVTARAVQSNAQLPSSSPVSGQTISVNTGTLGTPALVQSKSLTSRYVAGDTSGQVLATYNFTSSGGSVTIEELYFNVTSTPASTTITSVKVGNSTGLVLYSGATGSATVSGLNLVVPGNNLAGLDVPVEVTYTSVGPSGSPSGVTAQFALTGYKARSGSSVTINNSLNVAANTVKLVAGYPTLSVSTPSNTFSNGSVLELIKLRIGSVGGTINVGTTTFVVSSNNIGNVTVGTPKLYDAENNELAGANCTAGAPGSSVTVTCALPSGYNISGGSYVDLTLKAQVTGASIPGSGTYGVLTALGAANTFSWSDVSGGAGPYTTDNTTYFLNYPTQNASVRNY